jgi:hypothetical protein
MWAASGRGTTTSAGRSIQSLEVMLDIAVIVLVVATIAFLVLSGTFLDAVKREAPSLFETWGRPSVGQYLWRRKLFMPFSSMVLMRNYRAELASYPRSRAWASWLFLVHWVQLIAVVFIIVAVIRLSA